MFGVGGGCERVVSGRVLGGGLEDFWFFHLEKRVVVRKGGLVGEDERCETVLKKWESTLNKLAPRLSNRAKKYKAEGLKLK